MTVSWSDILEKAAANLSVEPSKAPPQNLKAALGGAYGSPWALRADEAASSRDALARELEKVAGRASRPSKKPPRAPAGVDRQRIAYFIGQAAPALQTPVPRLRRANSWRNIVAVLFSLAVIGSTAYAFLNHRGGIARTISAPAAGIDARNIRIAAGSIGLDVAEWRPAAESVDESRTQPGGWKPFRDPAAPRIIRGSDGTSASEPDVAAPAAKPLLAGLNQVTEQAFMDRAATKFPSRKQSQSAFGAPLV